MLRLVLIFMVHRPWSLLLALGLLAGLAAPRPAPGLEPEGAGPSLAVAEPPAGHEPPAATEGATAAEPPPWWNAGFQSTYVFQRKPSFSAPYSGPKSLSPNAENGYTLTATLFATVRAWPGAELVANPEVTQSQELSGLSGLAGLSDGEAQKSGGPEPKLYRARVFVRQTVPLGGEETFAAPGPNQLGGRVASRRLVITAGNFALSDVFDGNAYSHDPRTQFLNWTLMAAGATDYAADVRGYTWGLSVEWYLDAWAFRLGRFAQPKRSNGMEIDPDVLAHYGDAVEVERSHRLLGQPGKVRVLAIHNRARMGAFRDALDLAAARGGAPDFADVRRAQSKYALAVGFEQALLADVGLFGRLSVNDGRTETYAFTEVERSLHLGASVKGTRWRRAEDTFGVAWVQNELSSAHRAYVEAGGAGLFIGDGALRYRPERIVEAYYSLAAWKGLWISVDAQRTWAPAYNADRGPVNVLGCRFHAEY